MVLRHGGEMDVALAELAARFGLQPIRILQVGSGRAVAQVRDVEGNLFVLKTDEAVDAFVGDVEANRLLSAAGLPVPEVVAYQSGAPSVVILRWIDGDPITSSSPFQAQREVGVLLRALHSLPAGPSFSGQPTISSGSRPGPRKSLPGGRRPAVAASRCSAFVTGARKWNLYLPIETAASPCLTVGRNTSWSEQTVSSGSSTSTTWAQGTRPCT